MCSIYKHRLNQEPFELIIVFKIAIKIIKYINSRPLKSRLLKGWYRKIWGQDPPLLLHTKVYPYKVIPFDGP